MNIDFIIVGQGLAGSILAYSLIKKSASVKVIDPGNKSSASNAAAGIFNPITGRQMRKTWMAEELFSFLHPFYKGMEEELNSRFLYPMPVLRMFDSQKQINDWYSQMERPGVIDFLNDDEINIPKHVNAPLGLYATKKSGYLDVPNFIKELRRYFSEKQLLIEEVFDYEKLNILENNLEYDGLKSKKIIFCEGYKAVNNPYFNYLPLVPNKGEMLDLEIGALDNSYIYNKNGFMMPRPNGSFWVGSTYKRNASDLKVTAEGQKELIEKTEGITNAEYSVRNNIAGVRPTVKDRRPLIGIHPKFEQIGIFNGLGSKGVSLAPFWADKFCDHLIYNKTLHKEVNIQRYISLY